MEQKTVKVKVRNIAQSAQKLRLVADLVRGKMASDAVDMLTFLNKKGSLFVKKAIVSGLANADNMYDWSKERVFISKISVDEAPTYKRGRYASRGRASRILKRRSHLNLELQAKA